MCREASLPRCCTVMVGLRNREELNAAALVLAEGAEALGIGWSSTPFGTARRLAAMRLSWHVRNRLLDQRQAKRADHMVAACAFSRRGNP